MADRLHLEDMRVGMRAETGSVTVTAEAIKTFAAAFDPQPFHIDETAAEASVFGGLAASGWHTAALTMRLVVDGGLRFAGGLIGGGGEIRWPKPTRPGDTLRAVMEIEAITPSRSRPGRAMVRVRTETLNQNGETVQVLVSNMLALSRDAGAG